MKIFFVNFAECKAWSLALAWVRYPTRPITRVRVNVSSKFNTPDHSCQRSDAESVHAFTTAHHICYQTGRSPSSWLLDLASCSTFYILWVNLTQSFMAHTWILISLSDVMKKTLGQSICLAFVTYPIKNLGNISRELCHTKALIGGHERHLLP